MNIITKPLNNTLLVLLLVLGIENNSIQAQSFAGGSGTQADPYQVATASQLNDVRSYASAHFKQTANIDLNVAPYNSGAGWLPISSFSGTYDGNEFTISNLMINRPSVYDVGLFESTNGATLIDLTLTNASVKGHANVGALVGFASASSSITRVQIKGATVNATIYGGGIAGRLSASTVSESNVSAGRIHSKSTAGGLVGYQIDGVIRKSYTEDGSTTGASHAGGLVGVSKGNSITSKRVTTSYSSGMNITTSWTWGQSGGLVGTFDEGTITNSYSINQVSGVYAGGLVGSAGFAVISTSYSASVVTGSYPAGLVSTAGHSTITNSYYNGDSTSVTTSYGTELSTEEMSQQAFFTSWDFSSIWVILTEGEAFPELRVFGVLFAGGSGTRSDPYQVKTDKDINRIRLFPSAHFKQVADISLKAYQSGDGWLPVPGFTGNYDGGGYTISDLVIKRPNTNMVGLFADVNGATLTNLTLYKPKVTGKSFVGALAGIMNSASSVSKIHIKGEKDSVEDSVKGAYYIGGLVGSKDGGSISQSAVTDMNISASGGIIGGLAGAVEGSEGSISNSYAINKLTNSGDSQPGALVGYLSYATITNSYAIDKGVPDPPKLNHPDPDNTNYLYELVNSNGGTITNSYYICNPNDNNKNETGICTSDTRRRGNGTPLNMFGMRRHASFPGFDFTNTWYLDPEIPSDSPRLRALSLTPPEFAGGSGTVEDPYLVLTVIHLANIGLNPSAHYRQIADIYVGGPFRNNHTSWRPLPNFTGTYDGNGHTLSGLRVHWSGFDNIGLFSKVTGGTLTNIVLDKPDVIGSDKVGALAGEVSSTGTVTKVRVIGTTTGGRVAGKEKVGGLAGSNEGTISLTTSTGMNIEGSGYIIGGLVGYVNGTGSRIDNSYAINTLSSSATGSFPGGLVGVNSYGTITHSYTASSGGRGVVSSNNGGTITNSYYNRQSSAATIIGTPLTTAQMKQQASFSGFDFANTWIMVNEGGAFPNLRAFPDAGSMYAEGSGTEADPYRVATSNQLNNIRFFPNLHFRQTANIDLGTPPFDTGVGWEPILSFSGSYDGGGFIISNLFIDRGTTNNVGLFGILSGGSVTNLGLMKINVKGKENVGALAGYMTTGSEIRDSYTKGGTIQANKTTGGLVGKGVGLKVGTSYSSGISISAVVGYLGGLAGEMRSFEIKDSYAFNRLTGDESGGLVGTTNNGQISTSYSSSTNKGNKAGGLISNNGAMITNSYYNSDSTSSSNNFGTALSDENMRLQASFVGFDFTNTWQITGGSLPDLRTFGTFSFPYPRGIGTKAYPFEVSTAKQLDSVRNFSSAHFIQTADINLGVNPYKNDPGWNPIPNFKGSYDGNGFAISNLNIYRPKTENLGLFAKVTGAKLSNITLKNPFVFGNRDNIGVLAGVLKTSATTVTGVRVIGGNVRGTNKVGGLAGSSEGKISLSAVTGTNILGFDIFGGLVGSTIGPDNSITNSYSTSKLSGHYLVGGLVGRMNGTAIKNSYSTSEISGTMSGATAGGLVGEKTGGSISNSYYNKDYTATSAGGTGLNTAQMQRKASFVGFDFSKTWIMFSEGGLLPGLQTFVDFDSLFAGGSGTQSAPYQISKADHLYNVRFFPEAHFKQTANINLGVAPFNSDKGWLPIQDLTGIYDGGGYTISNLKIDRPVADTIGLFAKVTGARLTKLALSKPSVTGRNVVGALAGAINSTATKVNKIKITGGSITGGTNLGGLAGSNKGAISQSAAIGMTIQGSGSIIGGLAGSISGRGSSISDSYATNSVSSSVTGIFPGALLGVLNSGEVTKSYAVNSGSKGIVGTNSRGTITRSYFNGISTIGEGTGRFLTTAQMRQQHSFTGFNFDTTWVTLNEGGAFPELRAFVADYSVMFAGGSGTQADPYKIATAKQLYHVRQLPSRYYRQTADIDLGVVPYIHGKGWLPIQKFKGRYDGGGFSVSNITMNQYSLKEMGLFGKLDGGTLTNLDILTPNVTGRAHTGALVGSGINGCTFSGIRVFGGTVSGLGNSNGFGALAGLTNSCTVSDIEVSGVNINVVGNVAGDVGGVIGKGTNTTISRARISDLNLQSESDAGGIAGELNTGSSVSESSVTGGQIENGDHSGGLVGRMVTSSITNSYSNIAVNGTTASAGLVASLTGGSITTSYSSERAEVGEDSGAGLVSENTGGTITNSYFNSTAISNGNGNGTPLTEIQMKRQASFTGFDFSRIWFIDEDISFPGFQERKENELIIAGKQGWRMLTSPLHSHSIGTLFQDLWLQGFKGADMETGSPNLFFWDEVSKKWTAPSDTAFTPGGGKGFLMYVYGDDDSDGISEGFPKRLGYSGSGFSGNHTVNLTYTNSGSEDNDGWHLVGNPYPSTVYWRAGKGWTRKDVDIYTYIWDASADNGKGKYVTMSILPGVGTKKDGKIAPWQSFWVKTSKSTAITFSDAVKSAGGTLLKQVKEPSQVIPRVTLELEGNGLSSKSIVLFHEQAGVGKDSLDAYKLHSLNPEDYLLLGTSTDGKRVMEIQALPFLSSLEELELVIEGSNLNGEFTLNWTPTDLPEDWAAELVDIKTGEAYSLADTASYTFILNEAKAGPKEKETSKEIGIPVSPITPVIKSKTAPARFVIRIGLVTSNETDPDLPLTVELQQNYPNPFNPSTNIAFGIPETGKVTLEIFDVLGRKVVTLLDGENKTAGRYSVRFDARNLASGVYLYRLQAGNITKIKKLTLIK